MTSQPDGGHDADERLAEILDQFIDEAPQGTASAERLMASHPELAGELDDCLRALGYLHVSGNQSDASSRQSGHHASKPTAPTLGDYRIVREIGRGGMGIVFEAEQRSLRRRVALKVLPWATLLDRRQRERFRNEARLAARLHHSNIVPVFAIGSEQGVDFYAMQYIDGESLSHWARSRKESLTSTDFVEAVVKVGAQAADALAYAHRAGIIHRDIKPDNLLVQGSGTLWVTDFGVARSELSGRITATGDRVGTVRYMSPEQFSGQPIDHRTDIYALGATLWELLTAEQTAGTPRPTHPAGRNRELSRDLETILRKATAPVSADRYPSADEFTDDLKRFLRGEPVAARRPSLLIAGAKWVLRHRRLAATMLAGLTCAVVALAITTILFLRLHSEAEWQRDRAEDERRKAAHLAASERIHATRAELERRRAEQALAIGQAQAAATRLEAGDAMALLDLITARRTSEAIPSLAREIESLWSRWQAALASRLMHVVGHEQPVVQAAFSPNGTIVATASADRTVAIWDAATGKRIKVLAHDHPLTALSFSNEGDLLAAGDAGGVVRVWNTSDFGQLGPDLAHAAGAIRELTFHGTNRRLATVARNSPVALLWNLDSGQRTELKHGQPVSQVKFLDDGRIATAAGTLLQLWNVESLRREGLPIIHAHTITHLRVSPDGTLIAVGGVGKTVHVWDVRALRQACDPLQHPGLILDMQFSPDGRWLVTADMNRDLRRFDTSTWRAHPELSRHPKRITQLAFSPDSRWFATVSFDGGVRTWYTESGAPYLPAHWHQGPVQALAFAQSPTRLVTASDDHSARIWRFDSAPSGYCLQHEGPVRVAADPSSRRLAAGTWLGEIVCWDLDTRQPCWRVKGHANRIASIAVSFDGRLVATSSEDGTVRLARSADGEPIAPPFRFSEGVKSVAFQPNSKALLIGCNDKSLTLLDLATLEQVELCRDAEPVHSVAIDPAGTLAGYGTVGWLTHLRSLPTNKLIASLPHQDRVRSLSFAPSVLAVGGEDGVVRLWNVPGFSEKGPPLEQGGEVYDLEFHPGGHLMAAAVRSRNFLRLWDVSATYLSYGVPLSRPARPLSACFTPDGKLLATGWSDGVCWVLPVPEMPPDLAAMEGATMLTLGARLDGDGRAAAIPWAEWQSLRARTGQTPNPR